jgi:fructoselysine-6-P-deglycase FrlB-like protein
MTLISKYHQSKEFVLSQALKGHFMEVELISQSEVWTLAAEQAAAEHLQPEAGERVAVVGCGTSWFIAQSYAAAREAAGQGVTDAFAASEASLGRQRSYDRVVAISRSGTTTEILGLLKALRSIVPTLAVVGDPDSPLPALADQTAVLPYAE